MNTARASISARNHPSDLFSDKTPNMELRNHIKAPHRFGSQESEDLTEMQGTWWYSKGAPPKMPQPIPYNPYLPQAAFPTLDAPHKSNEIKEAIRSDLGDLGSIGYLADGDGAMEISPVLSPPLVPHAVNFRGFGGEHFNHSMYSSPTHHPSLEARLQYFEAEMQTSDEEDNQSAFILSSSKESPKRRPPQWDDVPDVQKLEILHGLMENGESMEVTMKSLGISPEQLEKAIHIENRHIRKLETAHGKMALLDEDLHKILITEVDTARRKLTSTGYDFLFRHHLGGSMNPEIDFLYTTTRKQLNKALKFLEARGLHPSLAGQWSELSYTRQLEIPEQRKHTDRAILTRGKMGTANESALENPSKDVDATQNYASHADGKKGSSQPERNIKAPEKRKHPKTKKVPLRINDEHDSGSSLGTPLPPSDTTISTGRFKIVDPPNVLSQDQSFRYRDDTSKIEAGNGLVNLSASMEGSNSVEESDTIVVTVENNKTSAALVQPKRTYTGTARPTMHTSSLKIDQGMYGPFGSIKTVYQDPATSMSLERQRPKSMKHTRKATSHGFSQSANFDSRTKVKQAPTQSEKTNPLPITAPLSAAKKRDDLPQSSIITTSTEGFKSKQETPDRSSLSAGVPTGSGSSTRSRKIIQKPTRYREDQPPSTPTTPQREYNEGGKLVAALGSTRKPENMIGKGQKRDGLKSRGRITRHGSVSKTSANVEVRISHRGIQKNVNLAESYNPDL